MHIYILSTQCCGSGAFLNPGSGIRDPELVFSVSRIPNPYVWELSENIFCKKLYNSLKIGPNFLLQLFKTEISVADPGCLSRILIFTHPGSRISLPGSKNSNKREGWKKICCHNFLCSHKFHKIANYFIWTAEEKIWANFQRIIELLNQNCQ